MLSLILVAVLLFGFAVQAPAEEKKEGGYVIGFSNFSIGNTWRQQMEAEFKQRADELVAEGVISEYYMLNAENDQTKQIADMRDLITKGCDAILITAMSADGLSAVCEEAVEEGIVVISFDNIVTTDEVTGKVRADDYIFGQTSGKWLGEQLGENAKVVLLNGAPGTSCDTMRREGGVSAMLEANPTIEIIAEANCDWDYAKGKAAMESLLVAHPEIDGVLSQGGASTQGAVEAFIAAGRDLVPMTGEASNGFLRTWAENKDNGFTSVAPCCPTYQSITALDFAVDALNGKEIPKEFIDTADPIVESTFSSFYKPDMPDSFWIVTKLTEENAKALFAGEM